VSRMGRRAIRRDRQLRGCLDPSREHVDLLILEEDFGAAPEA
jgi:hypothetical protein